MAKFDNENVSAATPRMGNAVTRGIGGFLLKLIGWKVVGRFPEEKKLLVIGAPHTSNWDFYIAMAAMLSVGLRFNWMMKKEAFFWPLGGLWKKMGGVPTDRGGKNDVVAQMAQYFKDHDSVWLGLTPEGTRSKVKAYKKGYLRIAYAANVPVYIIGINAPTKEVVLDRVWPLTYDTEVDNRKIKAYYDKTYKGVKAHLG